MTTAVVMRLVEVRCPKPLCPFRLKRGHGVIVGRVAGRAELKCPSCRTLSLYDTSAIS